LISPSKPKDQKKEHITFLLFIKNGLSFVEDGWLNHHVEGFDVDHDPFQDKLGTMHPSRMVLGFNLDKPI
jgi:hypothetical protein